ncbi:MAG: uracil-DNA glycosylase [Clostridiales bacterium]|nr:uracil-DNA glycosylase [Clostridiales bacterium]
MVNIGNSWDDILAEEFKKEYYMKLRRFLAYEYGTKVIYPDMNDIFNALKTTSYEDTKCVILGQDPYHGPGQAHGYAFSVQKGVPLPPSLRNIFLELYREDRDFKIWADAKKRDYDMSRVGVHTHDYAGGAVHGDLRTWAERGVLLLNTCLTVRAGQAGSHRGRGWEVLTDHIIRILGHREKPCVFILWGNPARAKKNLIDERRHMVIEGVHPSPLSAHRGFFGGGYFVKANEFLRINGETPIDWRLE